MSQGSQMDPSTKKRRRSSYKSKSAKRLSYYQSKSVGVARGLGPNSVIIPRIIDYDIDFTADVSKGFGFSANSLWVNGTTYSGYSGASEIYNLFDLVRVYKVEISIIPGQSNLELTTPSIAGAYNMPFIYEAFDPNDSTNPSKADCQELATCRTHRYGPNIIRRTIYPCLNEGNNVIDVGRSRSTTFVRADDNTVQWCAWKVYMDLISAVLTYDVGRISFKVYLECRNTK